MNNLLNKYSSKVDWISFVVVASCIHEMEPTYFGD